MREFIADLGYAARALPPGSGMGNPGTGIAPYAPYAPPPLPAVPPEPPPPLVMSEHELVVTSPQMVASFAVWSTVVADAQDVTAPIGQR